MTGIVGRDLLICPVCDGEVEHHKGYLKDHGRGVQQFGITTGKTVFCDGSNRRIPNMDLTTVRFTGTCPECFLPVSHEETETWPGSLPQYGGLMVKQCPHCSLTDNPECTHCHKPVCHQDDAWAAVPTEDEERHIVDSGRIVAGPTAGPDEAFDVGYQSYKAAFEHCDVAQDGKHSPGPVPSHPVELADSFVIHEASDEDELDTLH